MAGDPKKVHKLLGIKSMTADEFANVVKMKGKKRDDMLKDLAKKESKIKNYDELVSALEKAGLA